VKAGRQVELWAVVIGVSRYLYGDQKIDGNVISNLKNASDDADAICEFLRSEEGGAFRDDHVKLLRDEEATKQNVIDALAMLKRARPDDFFVIYIAAHGALLPYADAKTKTTVDIPYFLLHDTDLRDPERTALRMDAFRETVAKIAPRKGLVLSDTCYSGGVQLAGRASDESVRANQRYIDEMNQIPSGVGFISAARQTERSYEKDDFNHGVFTYCLLEALSGNGDTNQDEKVTFEEAVSYLDESVPALTGGKQHPHYTTTAIEANYLPLSVVSYSNQRAAGGAGQFGLVKVRVPDIDGVGIAIDDKPEATLDRRTPRTFKVPVGTHKLSFAKASLRRELMTTVEPGKLHPFTINLAFSESNSTEDSLLEPVKEEVNVFLTEKKEASKSALSLFQEGVDLFNKQKFRDAIKKLEGAAAANGGSYAEAFVYRGRAEQSLGDNRAAVSSFQRAFELRPSDFETETLLAEARFSVGDNLEEVQKRLRNIINRHPDFAFARVVLADLLLYQGKTRTAEWELRRAINIDPNYPAAYMILADVLTYQDSVDKQREAIAMAEKALKSFKEIAKKRVRFSTGLKRLSISHVIFGRADYSDDSVMAEAYHMLAKTRARVAENDKNISATEKSALLDSSRLDLLEASKRAQNLTTKRRLALVMETSSLNYFLKGDLAKAIEDGKQALKLSEPISDMKEFPDAHYTLYKAYESSRDYAKAAEHLQKFIQVTDLGAERKRAWEEKLSYLLDKARANRQNK
jgi:tetratricopeptide (TPR) repeat protein